MASTTTSSSGVIPLLVPQDHREMLEHYLPPFRPALTSSFVQKDLGSDLHDSEEDTLVPITLTYAMSLDSQISLSPGVQTILSGPETKAMTHYLRSRHNAILVGVGTAEADDPGLNCRFADDGINVVGLDRQPRPLILDPSGRWSSRKECKLLQLARNGQGKPPIWIFNKENKQKVSQARIDEVVAVGGDVIEVPTSGSAFNWAYLLTVLRRFEIHSLMVEGGGKVIQDLLQTVNRKFVACIIVTIAPVWLGEGGVSVCPRRPVDGKNEEVARLKDVRWLQMGQDVVMSGISK